MKMQIIRELLKDQHEVFFVLALILVTMMVDLLTGYANAWVKKEVKSSVGITGLIRKLISIVLLVLVAFISLLVPAGIGDALVMGVYIAYLVLEFTSVLENCKKLGIPIGPFEVVLGMLKTKAETPKEDN